MTPGRRRFTVAHELAHALFHSDQPYVLSGVGKDPRERFADSFAGEFLMPQEGVRRMMEEHGFGPTITEPEDVVQLQRFFGVSWATALVRLRQANYLRHDTYMAFKQVRPVLLARALGYETDPEEYRQDPMQWRLQRYPLRFLRLLRKALRQDAISVPSAASLVGVTVGEMAELAGDGPYRDAADGADLRETDEYEQTGVLG